MQKYPWVKFYFAMRGRCNSKSDSSYKSYGARGIKCLVGMDNIKFIWFRDKATLMKKPSLDRIDPFGNYSLDNIRFIEHSENLRRPKNSGVPVVSIDIKTGETKRYLSPNQASVEDGYSSSNISQVLRGIRKQHLGKYWRFV
jgi:hypothetical protein